MSEKILVCFQFVIETVYLSPGIVSMPSSDQRRRSPYEPRPGAKVRRHPDLQDLQGTRRASVSSWVAPLAGCSLTGSRGHHGSLTSANRINKESMKRGARFQGILGKVRILGGQKLDGRKQDDGNMFCDWLSCWLSQSSPLRRVEMCPERRDLHR